jgi:hypothetical protein
LYVFLSKKIKDGDETDPHHFPFGFLPPFGLQAIVSPPVI